MSCRLSQRYLFTNSHTFTHALIHAIAHLHTERYTRSPRHSLNYYLSRYYLRASPKPLSCTGSQMVIRTYAIPSVLSLATSLVHYFLRATPGPRARSFV